MTGIRNVSGIGGAPRLQGRTVQRAGSFSVAGLAPRPESAVTAAAAVTGLIAVQDEAAPARRNQAARRGGEAILHDLSRLQAALLGGQAPGAATALRDTLARLPEAVDPVLNGILTSIRLRARIELARRRIAS
jgi:hypothetical protein